MVTGMEHIGIAARDSLALTDWYVRVFGWRIVYDNKKTPPTFFLKLPDGAMVEIYTMDSGAVPAIDNKVQGIRHLALSCDEFDQEVERLIREGVEVAEPPKPSHGGASTFFFRDPEGNILHLIKRDKPL